MISLRRMRYLVTLAEEKNFTSAANILYISQPTLSQEIMKMEQEFGFKLFNRSSRSVSPTKEAERLISEAEVLLKKADNLNQMIASIKQEQLNTREFVIALDMGWANYEYIGVTRIINELRDYYPSVTIRLTSFRYPDSMDQLEDGQIQVAVIYASDNLKNSLKYSYRVIDSAGMCLAVPASQLGPGGTADIAKILEENEILALSADDDYMYGVLQLFKKYRKKPRILEVNDMKLMLEYIAAGGGVALIPNSYAETAQSKHIGIIELGEEELTGHLLVVWNQERTRRNKMVKEFVEKLVVEENMKV